MQTIRDAGLLAIVALALFTIRVDREATTIQANPLPVVQAGIMAPASAGRSAPVRQVVAEPRMCPSTQAKAEIPVPASDETVTTTVPEHRNCT